MIRTAVAALVDRDERLAVLEHEEEVDRLCIEIDDRCFTLLALRQPMASDLRVLVAGIKINGDLEQIGDQALSVALRARSLLRRPHLEPPDEILRMARLAEAMVQRSLEAFLRGDAELAREVIEGDDEVDELRDQWSAGSSRT